MTMRTKNLISIVILVILSSIVYADAWTNEPSHQTIFTDIITSRGPGVDGNPVTVADSDGLEVNGDIISLGNVGIGTTGPTRLLHVASAASPAYLRLDGGADINNGIELYETGNRKWIIDNIAADDHFRFYSDTTGEVVSILQSGNVGIGTGSPIARMEIEGVGLQQVVYDDRSASVDWAAGTGNVGVADRFVITASGTGGSEFQVFTDNVNYANGWATVGTNVMLRSNGNSYFNGGNVGIGTTGPITILDVREPVSAAATTITHENTAAAGTSNVAQLDHKLQSSTQSRTFFRLKTSANTITDATRNSLVEFKTNNAGTFATAMAIDGGNVGIGTTAPTSAKLQILNPDTASNYGGLYIRNEDNGNYGLTITGASTGGIYLTANADDQCYEQGSVGACSLNDYAEMMEFSEMPSDSDVVVIDIDNPGMLKVSTNPYDNLVAGIASEDPAMVIGSYGVSIKGWNRDESEKDGYFTYPLAIAGRKLIKVTDENGEVLPGDLLVTSSERGKAMKCDRKDYLEKCIGAVIGKAMTSAGDNEMVLALIISQ